MEFYDKRSEGITAIGRAGNFPKGLATDPRVAKGEEEISGTLYAEPSKFCKGVIQGSMIGSITRDTRSLV